LKLIAWRPSPSARTIERLFDREANAASALALCSTTTPSGTKLITSQRTGSGTLELSAYGVFSDDLGSAFVDCGDTSLPPLNDVTATTLAPLGAERIVSAIRISKKCISPSNQLSVTVYDVFDPPSPAPANVLEIAFQNPALPSEDDSTWAESGGEFSNEFPLSGGIEWTQGEQIGEHRCSGSRRGRELLRVVRLGAGRSPTGLNFNPCIIAPHRRLRISNVGFARSPIPRSLATNCRPDPKRNASPDV
jgi:hypothetical protein